MPATKPKPGADEALRKHLIELLNGGHAHATFSDAVSDMPKDKIGLRPTGAAHSAWELLEHLRIAQRDILEFSKSADYVSPKWPEAYWPKSPAPENPAEWVRSVEGFRADMAEFQKMVLDPAQDLYRPFPWGEGQTLLREAMLIADHNAYHIGQLVLVRRLLQAWPG